MIKNVYIGLHVNYPLFLLDLNKSWFFSTVWRRILKYHFFKSVQREPSCSLRREGWTDGRRETDRKELIVTSCNFVNAPGN